MNKLSKLIAVSVVGLSSSAMIVTVAASTNANNIPIMSGVQAAKLDERAEGGTTPGNAFYVMDYTHNDSYDDQWFVGNGSDVWVRFYQKSGNTEIGHADVNLGNQITFRMDYDWHARRVVAGIVPKYNGSVTEWTGAVVVRQTHGLDNIVWSGEDHHNQTADIALSSSTTLNAIRVNTESDVGYDKYISAAGRIERWADKENEWTSTGVCKNSEAGAGDTVASLLSASWERTASTYEKVGADVKAFFSNQAAREGGTICEDLAARYDLIMSRYGATLLLDNFASR